MTFSRREHSIEGVADCMTLTEQYFGVTPHTSMVYHNLVVDFPKTSNLQDQTGYVPWKSIKEEEVYHGGHKNI